MKGQARLSRSEVLARLREFSAQNGGVSATELAKHDGIVVRSLRLYFASFEAACAAARVPASMPRRVRMVERRSSQATWSRRRVLDELRRLERSGQPMAWAELMQSGHGALVAAAATYAGGLAEAREAAGVTAPQRTPRRSRWSRAQIIEMIRARARDGEMLASSKAPQRLVAAARWHFGSWDAALSTAGIDARQVRLARRPYAKAEILALMRELGSQGPVRASRLKSVVKLDTVRAMFGSVEQAARAAGQQVAPHPRQTWSRERVIEELRARAKQGTVTLTRGLARAVQLYFGGAEAARAAAGLPSLVRTPWTKQSLVRELQRRARRGDSGRTLWGACKRLFGSVATARQAAGVPASQRTKGMAAWDKEALLKELRRRVRRRQQLGRGLTEGLRRAFGSLTIARALAGMGKKASAAGELARGTEPARRNRWRGWSRAQVIDKLRAWSAAGGGGMRSELVMACRHHFGSVAHACSAAEVSTSARAWTPERIRRAICEPGFDEMDPAFVAACIDHFGSVTAARVAAGERARRWSKAMVIAELRARAERGMKGVGRLLRAPALRLFGSTEAALRASEDAEVRVARGRVSTSRGRISAAAAT